MKKSSSILLLALATIILTAASVYGYISQRKASSEEGVVLIKVEAVPDIMDATHGIVYFQDITIDTMMLGKWQHAVDTGWYRVYTMEPAGDEYCWGREWNTEEDIYEEDLQPYGNGWFKWKKDGDDVVEIHMTDFQTAAIPHEYEIMHLNNQQMRYKEVADAHKQQFNKCTE